MTGPVGGRLSVVVSFFAVGKIDDEHRGRLLVGIYSTLDLEKILTK